VTQRVGRGTALLFHVRGTRRGEWSAACHVRNLRPGKALYPFYRRLGGPQGWSGKTRYTFYRRLRGLDGRKFSSPPGFDPGPYYITNNNP